MSLWDSVGSTYVEAAAAALPLHRLVIFGASFLTVFAVENDSGAGVIKVVMGLSLLDLASTTTGPLVPATIGYVTMAVGAVLLSWLASRVMLRVLFSLAAKATQLWSRVADLESRSNISSEMSLTDRQTAATLLETSLRGTRQRLRATNAFAEMFCGLGAVLTIASHWGETMDLVVGIVMILLSIVLHFGAIRIFLAEYFGPALFKARLQGRDPPVPSDL